MCLAGGVHAKGSQKAEILTKKAVYGAGIIRYFEFEDSETGFGRMSLTYDCWWSQIFRTQNNELFRTEKHDQGPHPQPQNVRSKNRSGELQKQLTSDFDWAWSN